jgi:hypothetical protein
MCEDFGTAELREGESRDDDAHARRNAEMIRQAREELESEDVASCGPSESEQEGGE